MEGFIALASFSLAYAFIVLLGLVWFAKPPFGAGSGGGGAH